MRNASYPDISLRKPGWSPTENVAAGQSQKRPFGIFQWWYRLSTPPEPLAHAGFIWRENYRQACLFSSVALFLLMALVCVIPVCLLSPNPYMLSLDSAEIVITCVCLLLNRMGLTLSAGIVQVVSVEIVITSVIFIMSPLNGTNTQIVDLLIVGELLAVSLLPIRYVFLVALYNALFIWLNISQQADTSNTILTLHSRFISITAHTVGLQLLIAGISAIWVNNTTKAIRHANKAEIVSKLEHTLAEQREELEYSIRQILQTHVSVANGNLNARVPLTQNSILWPIARALNGLLVRFQRASIAERELYRVEHAITSTVSIIQKSTQRQQAHIPFTQTAIDLLLAAMQGKTFAFTRPLRQQSKTPSTDPINTYTLNGKTSSQIPP